MTNTDLPAQVKPQRARRRPYMPLYTTDWRDGTRQLTLEQKGLYIDLLSMMWERGGSIPADEVTLSAMTGLNRQRAKRLRDELVAAGKLVLIDGQLHNPRMERVELNAEKLGESFRKAEGILEDSSNSQPKKATKSTVAHVYTKPSHTNNSTATVLHPDAAREKTTFSWTEVLNPRGAGSGAVEIDPGGGLRLLNGTREKWVEAFGSADRLDLALTAAAPFVQPNSNRPLLVQVEAQLARQLSEKRDRDERYRAAAERSRREPAAGSHDARRAEFAKIIENLSAQEAARG
jgi:uncharacterized protein YdaU (DUF1376 family)